MSPFARLISEDTEEGKDAPGEAQPAPGTERHTRFRPADAASRQREWHRQKDSCGRAPLASGPSMMLKNSLAS